MRVEALPRDLHFPGKPDECSFRVPLRVDDFEGHLDLHEAVIGAVDSRKAAASEILPDLVAIRDEPPWGPSSAGRRTSEGSY